ncbi:MULTISPECIES: trypsin-like serine protease [unclassified Minwuia]|jgi:secreted trypsin-like serine protease|uniref:trypsin-like serine protease n=1 Tax=unclassified Minwuia TaxID=2618799 RepID=UPI00247A5122|nr:MULTISPECIES: trypsin-like serine protease [unclassified Minwuia]
MNRPKTALPPRRTLGLGLVLGFLAMLLSPHVTAEEPPKPVARIIGGHEVQSGARPWQVLLNINRAGLRYTCGATIISADWILTAAHCTHAVADRPNSIRVLAGTTQLEEGHGVIVGVREIHVHPDYDGSAINHPNDVSLLRLAEPLPFVPVRLMAPADEEVLGVQDTPGLVIGFGAVEEGGGASGRLLETSVPLQGYDKCKQVYGTYLQPGMICAGLDEGGRDTCQGDSGGPLLVRDGNGDFVQLGIVSWGAGCAVAGRYGVYTRITSYLDWIAERTRLSIATLTGFENDPQMVAAAAPPVLESALVSSDSVVVLPQAAAQAPTGAGDTPDSPATAPTGSAMNIGTILAPVSPRLPPPNLATLDIPQRPAGNRALLIGIDDYWDDDFDLTGSVADVERIRALLLADGSFTEDQIMVLTDSQATRANIHLAFEQWLTAQTRPDDLALLYFAGHGFHQQDLNGDEADAIDEAIVPYDANRFRARDLIRPAVMRVIVDDDIGVLLRAIADRRVTAIFDSCFSGSVTRNLAANVPDTANARSLDFRLGGTFKPLPRSSMRTRTNANDLIDLRNDNLVVWTAVSERELALVDRSASPPGGVFTSAFVEGLRNRAADADGDGIVSHAELLDHLRQRAGSYCKQNPGSCGIGLTPTLEAASEAYLTDVISRRPVHRAILESATGTPSAPVGQTEPAPVALAATADASAPQQVAAAAVPPPSARPEPNPSVRPPRPEGAPEETVVDGPKKPRKSVVHLEVTPTSTVKVGDRIRLSVTARREGRLFVIDVRSDGQMVQIFPNRLAVAAGQTSRIDAGETMTFPKLADGYDFVAGPPLGQGRLVAILADPESEVAKVLDRHSDLETIKDLRAYLSDVAAGLRQPQRDGFAMRLPDWTMHAVEYEIVQ